MYFDIYSEAGQGMSQKRMSIKPVSLIPEIEAVEQSFEAGDSTSFVPITTAALEDAEHDGCLLRTHWNQSYSSVPSIKTFKITKFSMLLNFIEAINLSGCKRRSCSQRCRFDVATTYPRVLCALHCQVFNVGSR